MDAETLIKVVALIETRLDKEDLNLDWAHDDNPDFWEGMPEYNFILGQRFGLNELKDYLQLAIDGDVVAMENSTGE